MSVKKVKSGFRQLEAQTINKQGKTVLLVTVPAANVWYAVPNQIRGQYVVTCVSTTTATILVPTGPETSNTYNTTSGTVTFTQTDPSSFYIKINTGTNIVVTFTQVISSLSYNGTTSQGTIDSITATGTYTQTGSSAIVMLVGGGNGGNPGSPGGPGGPGGSGGTVKLAYFGGLPGNVPVTVGAGGPAGSAGGTTTFGAISAPGGGGGGGGGGGIGPASPAPSQTAGAAHPLAPTINPLGFGFPPLASTPSFGAAIGGGGHGGQGGYSAPGPRTWGGGGGGGGGGAFNGSGGGGGLNQPARGGTGGAGGAGAVYVLRFP